MCWLLSYYFLDSNLLFYTLLFEAMAGTLQTTLAALLVDSCEVSSIENTRGRLKGRWRERSITLLPVGFLFLLLSHQQFFAPEAVDSFSGSLFQFSGFFTPCFHAQPSFSQMSVQMSPQGSSEEDLSHQHQSGSISSSDSGSQLHGTTLQTSLF